MTGIRLLAAILFATSGGAAAPLKVKTPLPPETAASRSALRRPTAVDQKIDASLRMTLEKLDRGATDRAASPGLESGFDVERLPAAVRRRADGTLAVPVFLRADDVEAAGRTVLSVGGTWSLASRGRLIAEVPSERLADLAASPAVSFVAGSHRVRPLLDVSRPEIQADAVHAGTGLPGAYQGAGVVVGIVDTGIDVAHADFKDATGKTRIQYLWDMTGSGSPPAPFNHGREYTKAQIDAGQCEERDDLPSAGGHGTHTAGIAAGNGRTRTGQPFRGIAPEADLVVVKALRPGSSAVTSSDVVEACDYIFQKAALLGKPAVINLSLGDHYGMHDGTSDYEVWLDVLQGSGKIIVAANGNDGARPVHLGYALTGTSYVTGISTDIFQTDAVTEARGAITGSAVLGFRARTAGTTIGFDAFGELPLGTAGSKTLYKNGTPVCRIDYDTAVPLAGGGHQLAFSIADFGTRGAYVIEFYTYGTGRIDCWVAGGGVWDTYSEPGWVPGDSLMTATLPATANRVVSVGSYVTKTSWVDSSGSTRTVTSACGTLGDTAVPGLSCFSSRGPTRDGRTKPDLAAPGQYVAAPLSKDLAGPDPQRVIQGGSYLVLDGTSVAAPHVTGLVALLLQAVPTMTPEDARQVLWQRSRSDATTGTVPNNLWGAGRVDAFESVKAVSANATTCLPSATTLCIDGNQAGDRRFKVEVDWSTVQGGGQGGKGTAVSTTPIGFAQGGIFWFFDPTNPEMLVKVLNGCGVNQKFWVFSSAGTNVGLTVKVADTLTGTTKSYVNPDLTAADPVQDVLAFACSAGSRPEEAGGNALGTVPAAPAASAEASQRARADSLLTAASCTPDATALCIDGKTPGDRRFKVQVDWSTVQGGGQSGKGTAVATAPIGFSAGGIFWFFDATNPEMLVKVLNGCGVNQKFWVFTSAGTNVGLDVKVTDTSTGALKSYVNPDLTAARPVQDVLAFSCD